MTPTPDAPGQGAAPTSPSLPELVALALEHIDAEGPAGLAAVCAEHPGQASALRARIEGLRAMGLVGTPAADAPLPERLGPFRILSRLGDGGMGVVYRAEQEGLGRQVALKLVRPELLYFPGARERFRREVEAVARLQHPGIVPVFAGGEDNGIPWCAMELVHGATLEELVAALAGRQSARLTGEALRRAVVALVRRREKAFPKAPATRTGEGRSSSAASALFAGSHVEVALRVAQAVAEALDHAHARGVLHRDVKPSNVMLTPEGRVLLLDFGLAAAEGSERLTGSGSQLGSLAWMSPEQVRGEHAGLDARTDVYSLGATLFELLALRSPFATGDSQATRERILEGRALPLRELNPAVSRDAETACLVAMERERERRYPDAAAFAADLGNVLALRPVAARRPGRWLRARRWSQRHPGAAAAIGLGTLVAVGGPLGYGLVQGRAAEVEQRLNDDLRGTNMRLDETLGELRVAHDSLQARSEDLAAALDEQTRQRERAERSFGLSLDAVDELLAAVGADDLSELPGFEPVRRQLLERALDFYARLGDEDSGSAARREQARTHRSMADLTKDLGRLGEARGLYDRSVAELRDVLREAPADDDARHALGSVLSQRGGLAYGEGRLDDAGSDWEEARGLLGPLAERPDAPLAWRHDLGSTLDNLGLLQRARGDLEAALELFHAAAALLGPLADAHPDDPDAQVAAAMSCSDAAAAASSLGRPDEALADYRDAWQRLAALRQAGSSSRSLRRSLAEVANNYGLTLMIGSDRALALEVLRSGFEANRDLAADFPDSPDYAQRAAVLGMNLAGELGNQERWSEAEPVAAESVRQLERVVADFPGQREYPYYLGATLSLHGGILAAMGDLPRAREACTRGVELLRAAMRENAGHAAIRAQLASGLFGLAGVQLDERLLGQARDTLEEGLGFGIRRPDVSYQGAETAARLARLRHEAASPDAAADLADLAGHADAADEAEATALEALRAAIEDGFADPERLRTNTDWAWARERPDFLSLVEQAAHARP